MGTRCSTPPSSIEATSHAASTARTTWGHRRCGPRGSWLGADAQPQRARTGLRRGRRRRSSPSSSVACRGNDLDHAEAMPETRPSMPRPTRLATGPCASVAHSTANPDPIPSATLRAIAESATLGRLLLPEASPALDARAGPGPLTWLTTADEWQVLVRPRELERRGEELMRFALPSGDHVSAWSDPEDGAVHVPFDFDEAYHSYVTEAWKDHRSLRALTPTQLQLYYRVKRAVPRSWLLSARRVFMRRGGLPGFPAWPLDESVDRLLHFYALCLLTAAGSSHAPFRWFWPRSHRAALILTHDVESAAGLRLAIDIADLEEARGFRSSFNVVGADYPIDMGIVRELAGRGFEIGLHGLHHDRSLFSSRAEFERQLPQLRDAAQSLGAVGFRSPATHRVVEWLPELPVPTTAPCSTRIRTSHCPADAARFGRSGSARSSSCRTPFRRITRSSRSCANAPRRGG